MPLDPDHPIEQRFATTPAYRDNRGYIWQRMRNGIWRSTDGVRGDSTPEPPNRWGPYEEVPPAGYRALLIAWADDEAQRPTRDCCSHAIETWLREAAQADVAQSGTDDLR